MEIISYPLQGIRDQKHNVADGNGNATSCRGFHKEVAICREN